MAIPTLSDSAPRTVFKSRQIDQTRKKLSILPEKHRSQEGAFLFEMEASDFCNSIYN
jgi:hypothetical protein